MVKTEQEILHTPDGVRDIYGREFEEKAVVLERMKKVIGLYGFQGIQVPEFEFFDVFNRERGSMSSRNMYKLIDRDGSTLVLRPDFTPSVARFVARSYHEETLPIRLCYEGETFTNCESYQGHLKEVTQIGAELINDPTADADAEMTALTIECLLASGLSEFQIEIGHADYFRALAEEAQLSDEEIHTLQKLIEQKNRFGVEEELAGKNLPAELTEQFCMLPEMFGDRGTLAGIKAKTTNARALSAIRRLENVLDLLTAYGFDQYVNVDLGMLSMQDYYTGIIFRAYTYGTGDAVISGGRYDHLLSAFGKEAPSIGFAVTVDRLMSALTRQKITVPLPGDKTVILYYSHERRAAIEMGSEIRSRGTTVELIRMSEAHDRQEYLDAAARSGAGKIVILPDGEETR